MSCDICGIRYGFIIIVGAGLVLAAAVGITGVLIVRILVLMAIEPGTLLDRALT